LEVSVFGTFLVFLNDVGLGEEIAGLLIVGLEIIVAVDSGEEIAVPLEVGLEVAVGAVVTCFASTWARSPSLDLKTRPQILQGTGFFILICFGFFSATKQV